MVESHAQPSCRGKGFGPASTYCASLCRLPIKALTFWEEWVGGWAGGRWGGGGGREGGRESCDWNAK